MKPVVKSPLEINLQTKVVNIFKNVLRSHLDKYVERPAQIDLAKMIGSSFINNNIYLAEAGVGTGKSFAYLVPVSQHFSQGPIVISTKTINLQEQLIGKDIPLIKKIMPQIQSLLAKGQSHFLCCARYSKAKFPVGIEFKLIEKLERWVQKTEYGDRSEAPPVPDSVWELINVTDCVGKDCNLYQNESCGYIKYKTKRKQFTGLLICNHNLLVDDLLQRARNGIEKWLGIRISKGLWPTPKAIIIDESHGLVDSARQELSQELSIAFVKKILNKIYSNKKLADAVDSMFYGKDPGILADVKKSGLPGRTSTARRTFCRSVPPAGRN